MENQKEKKSGTGKKIVLIIIAILLLLLLLAAVFGIVYLNGMMNLINRTDGTLKPMSSSEMEEFLQQNTDAYDPDFTGETLDPTDVTWATETTDPVLQGENIINVLLIGQDRRAGEYRARSDSMILCTVNKSQKTLTLTSFMRDMYIPIPGYRDNRINVSYVFGGMSLLDQCLLESFGVEVDGNFEVDFDGFTGVVDMVGGVDINLTSTEVNYMSNKVPGGSSLKAGINHLNGEQALFYARIRKIGNADFGRTERQRNVITSVAEKCRHMSVSQLHTLLENILPLMTTDMTNAQILNYAAQVIPLLPDLKIVTQRIPVDGGYKSAWISGMSVLVPDLEKNRQVLVETIMDHRQDVSEAITEATATETTQPTEP